MCQKVSEENKIKKLQNSRHLNTCEGQKLGLKHVLGVARLEGVGLPLLLPVPDEDLEIVGPGGQEVSAFVEVDGVDATLVALEFVTQLETAD